MTTPTMNLADVGETIARGASNAAGSAADSIGELDPALGAKFRHALESGKNRATQWTTSVQDGIRHDPIRSLLIAAAAGAVLGAILARRSR
jgi:ElaB/YqjD/DUF883 family membrane-anchored ribosome-binding protein